MGAITPLDYGDSDSDGVKGPGSLELLDLLDWPAQPLRLQTPSPSNLEALYSGDATPDYISCDHSLVAG